MIVGDLPAGQVKRVNARGKPKSAYIPRKLDRQKVQELRAKGLSVVDIAKHQGLAHTTVLRFLQRTEYEKKQLEKFKANRADEFANLQGKAIAVQHKILDTLDSEIEQGMLSTLNANEKARLLDALNNVQGTIYDKERLERGESTQNISTVSRMIDHRISSIYKRESPNIAENQQIASEQQSDSALRSATISGSACAETRRAGRDRGTGELARRSNGNSSHAPQFLENAKGT